MNSLELLPVGFIASYVFILGLCVGSFLNVVVLRGLSGEEFIFSRSRCPKCLNQLKWYMNIPLISYIFLKGKCAFCKTKISIQYPIVELICGISFLIIYLTFGLTLKTLFLWVIFFLFIAMSTTDIKEMVIIDTHAYILCAVGILYSYLNLGDVDIIHSLIGAVVGFISMEILANFGKLFCAQRMFGEGDSLIALGLGAIFGYKTFFIVLALSMLIQSLCALPMLSYKACTEYKKNLSYAYLSAFAFIIILFLIDYFKPIENQFMYIGSLLVISSILISNLIVILEEIKHKKEEIKAVEEEKFNLLPFGPAMIIASVACIFYLPQIKNYILSHFS